jgi:hypothetical protein
MNADQCDAQADKDWDLPGQVQQAPKGWACEYCGPGYGSWLSADGKTSIKQYDMWNGYRGSYFMAYDRQTGMRKFQGLVATFDEAIAKAQGANHG